MIPHEVAHALLAFAVGYEHEIPLWLHEGFAIRCEPSYVHRYYGHIASYAVRNRIAIPLARLLTASEYPEDENEVRIFYAESWALVDLLIDAGGTERLLELARDDLSTRVGAAAAVERRFGIRGERALENRLASRLLSP